MKKLVFTALCAVAMVACGGGGKGGNDDVTVDPDAFDAAPPEAACNPVTQAGCETGEKCAQLVESEEPFLARTACVPDGTVTEGGACTVGAAGATGYDDCAAGNDCLNGVCTKICDVGPPDGCRADGEAFGEGSYCTLYENLFTDNIGLCVPGCNPTADSVADGAVINDSCGAGNGCYLNATRGVAACAGVPAPAVEVTQNEDCYGPASGGCYLNGCASGFTALLNNKPEMADGSVCARYCSPDNTYLDTEANAQGTAQKCGDVALQQTGTKNGENVPHQCRFVQSFYGNTQDVPVEVGMCVPITVNAGGSWADCTDFDWVGLQTAYNDKADVDEANAEFDQFCLETPDDPENSEILPKCLGYFRGCISNEEEAAKLQDYGASPLMNRRALAKRYGIELAELPNVELEAF